MKPCKFSKVNRCIGHDGGGVARGQGYLQLAGIPGCAISVLAADEKDTHSMSPLKENENNSITTNDGIPSVR